MKASVVACILAALCVSGAVADGALGRHLLQSDALSRTESDSSGYEEGGAYASGTAVAKDGGSVTSVAKATSRTFSKAKSEISRAIVKAKAEVSGGKPAYSVGHAAAESIGYAIAKAYASAYASVRSTSKGGYGCASAFASAYAAAHGYAIAYAEVAVDAINGYGKAKGDADAKGIAGATAEAFSKAEAEVCVGGYGAAVAYQRSFAQSLVSAYASAVVKALAYVKPDGTAVSDVHADAVSDEKIHNEADTKSFTKSEGEDAHAHADGVAAAQTTRLPSCNNTYLRGCCYRPRRSRYGYSSRRYGYRCRARRSYEQGLTVYRTRRFACICY